MSNVVGVIVGRFQVENLHEGHRYLINEAFRNHKKVIILIGCSPIQGTKHDPLDYHTRERMLRAAYPDAIISHIHDMQDDHQWSQQVDDEIRKIVPNLTDARLYGGRDSFKAHYHGKFTAIAIESGIQYQSGTAQREDIGKVTRGSSDFRAGIIYSTQNSWPYVKMCVDIACVRNGEVLMGRKSSEIKWRLPGGMLDKGETLEAAAFRELAEETDLRFEKKNESGHWDNRVCFKYIGSAPVGDWRMKNAGEIGLLTALFVVEYNDDQTPKAGDDLAEIRWIPLKDAEEMAMKGHKPLIALLKKHLEK